MADDADKPIESAEKAYAEASAALPVKVEPVKPVEAKPATEPVAMKAEPTTAKPAAEPKAIKLTSKTVKTVPTASGKVKKAKPARKVAKTAKVPKVAKVAKAPKPTITELKDKIMATAKTPDFTKTITDTVGEFQKRAKEAYEKGAEMSAEATEFAKGNVEALVESSKILAAGVQDLGKTYAEEAKSAYETASADLKELVAVKSPTELFQLQSKLLRRNLDSFMSFGSKNTETVVKLASETFAPISGRVSLAAEKLAKVA